MVGGDLGWGAEKRCGEKLWPSLFAKICLEVVEFKLCC